MEMFINVSVYFVVGMQWLMDSYNIHNYRIRSTDAIYLLWACGDNHQNDDSRPRCAKHEWKTVSDFY